MKVLNYDVKSNEYHKLLEFPAWVLEFDFYFSFNFRFHKLNLYRVIYCITVKELPI